MGESRQQCSQHLGINEEKLLYEQSSKTNAVQLTMELQTPTQMKCQKRYESLKKPQQLFRVDASV